MFGNACSRRFPEFTASSARSLASCGSSYSEVVGQVRNDEAARLLKNGQLNLTEIGYVCGFSDSAHFSRSFKKRQGVSPEEYRERLSRQQ